MVQPQQQDPLLMTEAEYLTFEEVSETKHEFVNGQVYAMAGAGITHNVIDSNANTMLNTQLFGKPCLTMASDMRVKVASKKVSYRYPDVVVVCGDADLTDSPVQTILNPIVIIEVLSPSTALKDYNQKLAEYIQIPHLQDYLLISQHEPKVERYSRDDTDKWIYTLVTGLEATIDLTAIDCTLSLARLYDKTGIGEPNNDLQHL